MNTFSSNKSRIRHRWPLWFVWALMLMGCTAAIWSWNHGGIVRDLFGAHTSPEAKLLALRDYFAGLGAWAPLAYFSFVVVEVVVAPIPGAMLYAPGGLIFGGFWGGLLSLAGNTAGAGMACWMTRTLGGQRLSRLVDAGSLAPLQSKLARRGFWIVFLLRINPLTSTDLISYAAGPTRIPIWQLMLATMLGMAPLCFAQSYLSEEIFTSFPSLLIPLLVAGVGYLAIVLWVIRGLFR